MTLSRWVAGLRQRGHRVSLVRPRRPGAGAESGPDLLTVAGMALPGYPGVRLGVPAGRRLRERWRADRPDVVYVATEGPLGFSALGAARALGVPALTGFHTNFHAYAAHYRLRLLAGVVLASLRRFHNRSAGTLVPTPELAADLRGRGFRNVAVVERGVDSGLFNRARRSAVLRRQWKVPDTGVVALYVGRVAPEKNPLLAIQAWQAMRREVPAARLVVVGDGPLRPALMRRYPDVVWAGVRRGEDLAVHYASSDMFLFPSTTETFGNVTLEAMASGLAVVAFDRAAAAMHIVDGVSGVLVPPGQSAQFVRAAAALARQPQGMAAMGRAARHHAEEVDWTRVIARLEWHLRAATGGDGARGALTGCKPGRGIERAGA